MTGDGSSSERGLRLDNVTVRYSLSDGMFKQASIAAALNVNLAVEPGQVVGLVGESGCGKSTLAKTITGLQSPTDGRVLLDGVDLSTLGRSERQRTLAAKVSIVFQDPSSSLNPRLNVRKIVRDPLEIHDVGDAASRNRRVDELLDIVGLGESAAQRRPGELSGGQRQRIAIARALALDPSYLIADEPTSALDVSVRAQVLNLLVDLRDRLQLGMLYISHDIQTVNYLADEINVMYLGRIVEAGTTNQVSDQPEHPYTKSLFSATPSLLHSDEQRIILDGSVPSARNPPSGCPFRTRCDRATDKCATEFPASASTTRRVHCFHPLSE